MIDCIPGYRLLTEIGRGTFGIVWKAEEIATGRHVALKTLPKSKTTERELNGIRSYFRARLRHPAIVEIFHVNETPDSYYYTMELADDGAVQKDAASRHAEIEAYVPHTLRQLLKREGSVSPTRSLEIAEQILAGLAYLHANSLIHRDVKPENILFVNGQVKLGDWGLVASLDGNVTMIGTRGYLPPDDKLDHTADLYATGKILYELITGFPVGRFPDLPNRRILDPLELSAHATAIRTIDAAAHKERNKRAESAQQLLDQISRRHVPLRIWRRPIGLITGCGIAIVGVWLFANLNGRQSTGRGDRVTLARILTDEDAIKRGFRLEFEDGKSRDFAFQTHVRSIQTGTWWFGKRCIAIGCSADGPDAGKVIIYDEQDCRGSDNLTPVVVIEPYSPPPKAWSFQTHEKIYHTMVLPAVEIDENPGEELVVAVQHNGGPCEIVVFGSLGAKIGSFWHYGWLNSMNLLFAHDQTPARFAFSGIANNRPPEYGTGAMDEPLHSCMLVLGWEVLRASNGYWGSQDWLWKGTPSAPIAYGIVVEPRIPQDGRWSWATISISGQKPILNAGVKPDFRLDLTEELVAKDFVFEGGRGREGQKPPYVAREIWQRKWPELENSAKEPGRVGE